MDDWKEMALDKAAIINPTEPLSKGVRAKKIAMTIIQPFTKRVNNYSVEEYNGGMKFRNGDTLIARITPCLENGKTVFVDILDDGEIGFGSTEYIVLREKPGTSDKNFLYYFAISTEFRDVAILSMTGSSGRQRVETDVVRNHLFSLPPLPEQKAIASILSSLDDKIDLLHRQNKTLEAMAETLFRQWFVEEAGNDWKEISLGECCKVITKGTTPTTLKKQFVSSGINFIKVNCIDETGNFLFDKFEFIDKETNELLNRSKLKEGDILYSIAGTIGRLIVVDKEVLPANTNQALAIIRVNPEKINPIFIKYCLKDREITENLHSKVVHAVQPNLSLGEISKTTVPFPPKEVMKNFTGIVEPIEFKLKINKSQIHTLEKLRDTLLPKLMSGEVRVEYEN